MLSLEKHQSVEAAPLKNRITNGNLIINTISLCYRELCDAGVEGTYRFQGVCALMDTLSISVYLPY
jgi:hypothetical protein